jgi:putative FmdB family regulatory protein
MPRYEYKCKKCGHQFEVTHGINDNIESCESCGGEVRRVFHPVGIVFKGSGFYATDAKKPSNRFSGPSDSDFKTDKDSSDGNGDKKKDDKKPEKSGKSEGKSK